MKKVISIVIFAVIVSTVISSCAARHSGCPTTNPRYFRG